MRLDVPQNDDPPVGVAGDPGESSNSDGSPGDLSAGAPGFWRSDGGLATAQLDRAVVSLPEVRLRYAQGDE